MAQFTFFATLYATLVAPLMAQMQALLGNVCAVMEPIALVYGGLTIAYSGYKMMFHAKPAGEFFKELAVIGLIVGAMRADTYIQYVSDFFLQGVPNTVSGALGGANFSPVSALDQVLGSSVKAAAATYEAFPSMSLRIIPLGMGVLVFAIVAGVSLAASFAIYMIASITNIAIIVVGPIFLAAAILPWGRRYFNGWLSVAVGGCVTQIMVLAVMVLMIPAENAMINQVVTTTAASDSNILMMLWGLFQAGLMLALCTAVVKKIPDIAQAIAGGVYHGSSGASASTFGAAGAAADAVGGKAKEWGKGAYNKAKGAVNARMSSPTGKSLSGP
jgi:type IV secretion system protein VirB6